MLTDQEITDAFINKLGEPPEEVQLEIYRDFTIEDLNKVLDRRLAIEQDPTFTQRVAEDYIKFMYATPEEQSLWTYPEPIPQNK